MKIILAAASAALFISSVANAEILIVAGVPTQHVGFGDLNLNSQAGLDTLRARVRGAARNVCVDGAAVVPVEERIAIRSCVSRAVADSDRQMAPTLAHRTGGSTLAIATLVIRGR